MNALGDPTRRTIFQVLARGPRSVGELAKDLPVSRPAVSQHLRVLKEVGLVIDEKVGNRRLYRLNPAGVQELRVYLDRLWGLALAGFQDAAESAEKKAQKEGSIMTERTTELVVRKSITVEAAQERAFAIFTGGLATWWPLDTHHIGRQKPQTAVLEPRPGGRWYERAADGTECNWGHVLAWEPPSRVVLSWEISADWQSDPGTKTEVEVRFIAEGPTTTRVELEHRGLESYGDKARAMQARFESPGGWGGLLTRFAETAKS
jgi:uncharacterized protein YndB with AHSA1/START domain/DNA-binding HxlR family transcriptional regulator